jgi:ribosomal RNA assembly protein
MRIIEIENMRKIKKAVPLIENKIKIKISFGNGKISILGNELNEFLVEKIIQAIDFGFYPEDALLLKNEDFVLEFIDIKEHTRRKNLKDVRARIIGTKGKAKKTLENLTGAVIFIKSNQIGVIVDSKHLDMTIQAIESLIRGSKHGNVFSYIERQNSPKDFFEEDLGLKKSVKEKDS